MQCSPHPETIPIATNMNDHHFLISREATNFTSRIDHATRTIKASRTVVDLAKAMNTVPVAPSFISWMPEVKRAKLSLTRAGEAQAASLVKDALDRLRQLAKEQDSTEFMQAIGRLSVHMRHLGGHTPIALRNGLNEISKLLSEHRTGRAQQSPILDNAGEEAPSKWERNEPISSDPTQSERHPEQSC